jgi:hypothetical protein
LPKFKSLTRIAPALLQNNRKEHACFHCGTQNSTQPTRVCEKNLVKYIKFWRADFYYFCTHPLPPSWWIWEGHIMPHAWFNPGEYNCFIPSNGLFNKTVRERKAGE